MFFFFSVLLPSLVFQMLLEILAHCYDCGSEWDCGRMVIKDRLWVDRSYLVIYSFHGNNILHFSRFTRYFSKTQTKTQIFRKAQIISQIWRQSRLACLLNGRGQVSCNLHALLSYTKWVEAPLWDTINLYICEFAPIGLVWHLRFLLTSISLPWLYTVMNE